MEENEKALIPFQLISIAGNARSLAIKAVQQAKEGSFDEALKLLEESNDELVKSHQFQTDLLVNEARGMINDVNILLVHAMDHLSMAIETIDNAETSINLYQKLAMMQEKIEK